MKMNFKYVSMMACAALMAGFTSCSNDSDADVKAPEGRATTMKISLITPTTRTNTDEVGRPEESNVKEISVWVYDKASGVATIKHIAPASGTTATFETTSGEKLVWVGANLSSQIKANLNGIPSDAFGTVVHTLSLGDLESNGLAMFAYQPVTLNLVEVTDPSALPASNKANVEVERMVAKVVVAAAETVDVSAETALGGTFDITNMEYTVRQVNRFIYTTKQSIDPNYGNFKYDPTVTDPNAYGLEVFDNTAAYQAVAEYPATSKDWNDITEVFYLPENLESTPRKGSNTYAAIKAVFKPTTGAAADGSFATYTNETGDITFFATVAEAEAANVDGKGTVSGLYEQGNVYYRAYLTKATGYNVVRNDYYRVRIDKISGLGSWKDKTEEPVDPKDPDKPEEPIDEYDSLMEVTVTVLPWVLFPEEGVNLQ